MPRAIYFPMALIGVTNFSSGGRYALDGSADTFFSSVVCAFILLAECTLPLFWVFTVEADCSFFTVLAANAELEIANDNTVTIAKNFFILSAFRFI